MEPDLRSLSWRKYCAVAFSACALLMAFGVARSYVQRTARGRPDVDVSALIRIEAPTWLALAILLPIVVVMCVRWPIRRAGDWPRIALYAVAFPLFHVSHAALMAVFITLVHSARAAEFTPVDAWMWVDPMFVLILYASVTAILHLLRYSTLLQQHEVARAEAARDDAELRAGIAAARVDLLQRQLQPHFLFNALNTISALVTTDPSRARQLVNHLAALLRQVLARQDAPLVTLADEMTFLRDYIALQQARFRERLSVTLAIDPDTLSARLPWMILQPLVENAIAHGNSADGTCRLRVTSQRNGAFVVIRIADEGRGFREELLQGAARPTGVGLANTAERLESLYGGAATLRLENDASGGASVTLRLPQNAIAGT